MRITPACITALICLSTIAALTARAEDCAALKSLALPDTTITLAEVQTTGTLTTPYGETIKTLPSFCRVAGVLRPTPDSVIHFEVWLPLSDWNGRFLGVGNGGYAGTINFGQMGTSVREGYATAGTDTGHQANAEDASWAYHHPEKIVDYGYRALHLTTLRAKDILTAFYRHAANHSYFDSCSTGGREALMEAQRFPEDYDGILAGAPANNWTRMLSSGIDVAQTMTADPAAYISSMKLPAIQKAALAACDKLDGVEDGIVNNPEQCRFDPATLLCKGEETLSCLTAPQVKSLRKLYAGGTTRDGAGIFPGYTPGSEQPGWDFWVTGAGPGAGAGARYPVQFFRYMVYDDPNWEILTADAGAALKRASAKLDSTLPSTDPDLSRFAARGGKLVVYHGWNDAAISPYNSIAYVGSVEKKMGAQRAGQMLRLYMVPGMEHCAGGPGPSNFGQLGLPNGAGAGSGALDALQTWVEQGTAPGSIVASKTTGQGKAATVTMTRPLCPYPEIAKYKGTGSTDVAASFACTKP